MCIRTNIYNILRNYIGLGKLKCVFFLQGLGAPQPHIFIYAFSTRHELTLTEPLLHAIRQMLVIPPKKSAMIPSLALYCHEDHWYGF